MKELTPLLEKLAAKLGTTVEMLWDVMLKQAMIRGVTDLIICTVLIVGNVWLFRLVQRKTTCPPVTAERQYPRCEWDDVEIPAWTILVVVTLIVILCVIASVPDIITAFANPQYWALEHILNAVKR